MVKTHPYSRFVLKSLDEIHESKDIVLQAEQTESRFSNTNKTVYLCEVVSKVSYNTETVERLTEEIIKVNTENRRLQKKIERLERMQ